MTKDKSYYYSKLFPKLPRLDGKAVVITGTSSGLGLAAVEALACLGAELYLLNRSVLKAQVAVTESPQIPANAKINYVYCDLQNLKSVAEAAEEIKEKCKDDGIYCLANNAGVMMLDNHLTQDGYDIQIQTNVLAHYLLTMKLLPLLEMHAEKFGEARIINHSSLVRTWFPPFYPPVFCTLKHRYFHNFKQGNEQFNANDVSLEERIKYLGRNGSFPRLYRYRQTKLANSVFTYALIDKLGASSKVKVLTAHPGSAKTELLADTGMSFSMSTIMGYLGKFIFNDVLGQPVKDAALGMIMAVALSEDQVQTGNFFGPGRHMAAFRGKAKKYTRAEKASRLKYNKKILVEECDMAVQSFLNDV